MVSGVLGPVVANSLGLIFWWPRPGRFSSELRCKWTIRTFVEISEESRRAGVTSRQAMMTIRRGAAAGWILVLRTRPAARAVVSVPRSRPPARRLQRTGSGSLGTSPEGSGSRRSAGTSPGRSRADRIGGSGCYQPRDRGRYPRRRTARRCTGRCPERGAESMEGSADGRSSGNRGEMPRNGAEHRARASQPPIASTR